MRIRALPIMGTTLALARMGRAESAVTDSTASPSGFGRIAQPVLGLLGDVFGPSAEELQAKLLRVAIVILIATIAVVVMKLLTYASHFLVLSDWGPLRHLFPNHQRALTVHSLVINLIKYIVYFTAFGYILSELGVDYRAYMASLSLIGVAVGFGSQGLVQDVVTGFFILFENQFIVGDMVTIGGQTGVVETIGLRTTCLRNYQGEAIIFQNRNIPIVNRFASGGMEAIIDVAVADESVAEKARAVIQKVGDALAHQFGRVILAAPEVTELTLETGEVFVRMKVPFWPAQQWVIEAQMVPRVREAFAREQLPIPNDRVVVFYRADEDEDEDGATTLTDRVRDLVRSAKNQHERIAMTFACKGAVKAGQRLTQEEMAELFDALFATELPYHDVHGRPTIVRLSSGELERKFGRH